MGDESRRIGDYEVLSALGSGGMGRVFKVRNVISNREEAMKILLPDFASDPDLAARFMVEIRTLAGLEHPGIAQLRTAFQYQNQLVMVMEYVEGTTLDKIETESAVPLEQMLDYAGQVLAALSYAHSRGVTHRDIKPTNIMITTHGVVKLMDFGIAKSTGDMQLTRPGTTMGSVYYMSPEQVRGGAADARSDLYSFGVTLYEMLTGRRPFLADTSYSVLNAQLHKAPTPPLEINPALSPELNNIVLRAMAKAPEERFQTADEFRNALKGLHEPLTGQVAPTAVLAPPFAKAAEPQTVAPGIAAMGQAAAPQAQAEAPPQPPAFSPVAIPAGPAVVPAKTHRGLWIGLGAVTAVLALAAMATVLPRVFSTHASQQSSTQKQAQTPAAAQPDAQHQPPAQAETVAAPPGTAEANAAPAVKETGDAEKPVHETLSTSAKIKPAHAESGSAAAKPTAQTSGENAGGHAANANASVAAVPAAAEPPAQEVKRAHDRIMNLDARAQSADSGVQQIRSQQQAQGLDLRGDVLASMNRMHNLMNEANSALARNDLEAANEYMERADREIAILEKFLGH